MASCRTQAAVRCGVVHVLTGCKDGCGDGKLLARGALQLCKSSVWVAVLGTAASPSEATAQ